MHAALAATQPDGMVTLRMPADSQATHLSSPRRDGAVGGNGSGNGDGGSTAAAAAAVTEAEAAPPCSFTLKLGAISNEQAMASVGSFAQVWRRAEVRADEAIRALLEGGADDDDAGGGGGGGSGSGHRRRQQGEDDDDDDDDDGGGGGVGGGGGALRRWCCNGGRWPLMPAHARASLRARLRAALGTASSRADLAYSLAVLWYCVQLPLALAFQGRLPLPSAAAAAAAAAGGAMPMQVRSPWLAATHASPLRWGGDMDLMWTDHDHGGCCCRGRGHWTEAGSVGKQAMAVAQR
eukprot:COSAG01_NODE_1315_length_10757_cov_13.246669_3_plen_293_part_00